MADFFGEVVHPNSRAFWTEDDDESEEAGDTTVSFTIDWTETCPEKMKTLIIAETPLIKDFIEQSVIQDHKSICSITSQNSKESSRIHRLPNDVFLCLIDSHINLTIAGDFIEAISPILSKSENTIAITCNHVSQLKCGEKAPELSFIRSLSTRGVTEKQRNFFPVLSQPNIVAGVAAGVISHAEVMNLPGTLAVLYLDGFELDSQSAQPLIKLFKELLSYDLKDFNVPSSLFLEKGNLYM
ncbi:proteasome assembly chaperone 1 [Diachasmimorpha longicaudata]|uniref:proteasome assembly chaperone 1 n=1 Tax=Diachasmimorpha longicaudata TaxID=58733 RepID=UPI0030B8DD00